MRSDGSKHARVRERLLAIVDGLEVGAPIPAERGLAAELAVSRPTLRAAIGDLVHEGLLVRRHGSGTYVAEPKLALPLALTSFSEDMRRRGLRPGSRVRSFAIEPAGARVGQRLRVSPATRVVAIERLRLADDEPMAVERLHVPAVLVPGLQARDLEGASFYDLLEARYGVRVTAGRQTIEPTVTDEEESAALGLPLHAPAFLFERVSESQAGEAVELVRSVYRGDRYRLVAELRPPLRRPVAPAARVAGA